MSTGKNILNALRQQLNLGDYRKKHWEGTSRSTWTSSANIPKSPALPTSGCTT